MITLHLQLLILLFPFPLDSNQFKPRRDIIEQNEHEQITPKKTFNVVKKDDPYKVYEQLQLTLEEVCQVIHMVNGKLQSSLYQKHLTRPFLIRLVIRAELSGLTG